MVKSHRIPSIDILRGLVMIIMALDHTRDFFHIAALTGDPIDPKTTTVPLFFTRWITHFCAPVFILLSGTAAYLSAQRKTKKEASIFLIKRGFWLIFLEIFIITLAFTFNPLYNVVILQVIWATGWSMIILGLLLRTNFTIILITGLVLFCGHNLLDYASLPATGVQGIFWKILFKARGYILPLGNNYFIGIFYAILPWTGVMLLGYCMGHWYKNFSQQKRKKYILNTGVGLTILFILLRIIDMYGNPEPRELYSSSIQNIFSFLNTSKYPPSLQYLSMTLGPALVLLSFLENVRGKLVGFIIVYGQVPLFYYILHFYLLHFLVVIIFFTTGHGVGEIVSPGSPILFRPLEFGFGLPVVYLLWIFVVIALYRPCVWYQKYKATHGQWWLSYI